MISPPIDTIRCWRNGRGHPAFALPGPHVLYYWRVKGWVCLVLVSYN